MDSAVLHHVSVVSTNLARSTEFYGMTLGLKPVARPPFASAGAWLASGSLHVHLIHHPGGTFRSNPVIDPSDVHFAIRVGNFEAAVSHLAKLGFREDAADTDPLRMVIKRTGPAGFPQAYIVDPDRHIVEINAAS